MQDSTCWQDSVGPGPGRPTQEAPNAKRTADHHHQPSRGRSFHLLRYSRERPEVAPNVKEIASEGPPTVGSRVHQVIAGPGGRGIPADIEVTAYEPPRHYAFKVTAGPARPTGEFRLAPAGAGTELTFSLSAELTGLKKLFMSGPVQKSMDGEMASLDTAKRLIEGS